MKRFEFKKIMVESPIPPKDTNMLWVDTNEASAKKEVLSIKEFINNEWVVILEKPAEVEETNLLGD